MLRHLGIAWAAGLLLGAVDCVHGFSLLGPLNAPANASWQQARLGYNPAGGEIGNPMNLGEEYRWSSPIVTYAFDQSFLNYFGAQGVAAVEEAIAVLNGLPRVSQMSLELTEFPTENRRINYTAQALNIQDLKSTALHLLVEVMGLASAEEWVWALRERRTFTAGGVTITNYLVIQRNFDPVTYQPTNRVNNAFYSYQVREPLQPGDYADAIEVPVDPLQFSYSSLAGRIPSVGEVIPGLTRDDAGGWRYLLRTNNFNVENLPAGTTLALGVFGGQVVSPWLPYQGTNVVTNIIVPIISAPWAPFVAQTNLSATNLLVDAGLRGGVDKITFVRTQYDSLLGQAFLSITNAYTDLVISNNAVVRQAVQRAINTPDLLFTAQDLGVAGNSVMPVMTQRGVNFVNNDALNGNTTQAGPGVLAPPVRISFSDVLPGYINQTSPGSSFLTGPAGATRTPIWGWFDATPRPPIIFPNSLSIQELEALVLGP